MVLVNFASSLFVFIAVAHFATTGAVPADDSICSAKYESELEDACKRGYRMNSLADGRPPGTLNGVTCSDSCDDTYKGNNRLIEPCKFGCGIGRPPTPGDDTVPISNIFSKLHTMLIGNLRNMLAFFHGSPSSTAPSDNTGSEDKSQVPEQHSQISVKRVRIIVPLGHPELSTVLRSSQNVDGGSDPFGTIKRIIMGLPSDETAAKERVPEEKPVAPVIMQDPGEYKPQDHPWLSHFRFIIRAPQESEDSTRTSFGDRFSCLLRRINPVFTFLTFLLILSIAILVIQLIVSCCRRRRRSQHHEYTALPAYFEDPYHAYPDNFMVKQKDIESPENVKSKEALGV